MVSESGDGSGVGYTVKELVLRLEGKVESALLLKADKNDLERLARYAEGKADRADLEAISALVRTHADLLQAHKEREDERDARSRFVRRFFGVLAGGAGVAASVAIVLEALRSAHR